MASKKTDIRTHKLNMGFDQFRLVGFIWESVRRYQMWELIPIWPNADKSLGLVGPGLGLDAAALWGIGLGLPVRQGLSGFVYDVAGRGRAFWSMIGMGSSQVAGCGPRSQLV